MKQRNGRLRKQRNGKSEEERTRIPALVSHPRTPGGGGKNTSGNMPRKTSGHLWLPFSISRAHTQILYLSPNASHCTPAGVGVKPPLAALPARLPWVSG